MNKKEKIEVFGTWVFAQDNDDRFETGIMPYVFYPYHVELAVSELNRDYRIEKMGVVTLVEDVFEL